MMIMYLCERKREKGEWGNKEYCTEKRQRGKEKNGIIDKMEIHHCIFNIL